MFRKNKIIEGVNYLELTPSRIHQHELDGEGKVLVLVPRFRIEFLQRVSALFRKPYVKAKLDRFGSSTWLSINGERNVSQIIDILKKEFGQEIEPAEERITKYLTQLYGYRFISFNELISGRR